MGGLFCGAGFEFLFVFRGGNGRLAFFLLKNPFFSHLEVSHFGGEIRDTCGEENPKLKSPKFTSLASFRILNFEKSAFVRFPYAEHINVCCLSTGGLRRTETFSSLGGGGRGR